MIRFKGAPEFTFTADPQINNQPATVYREGSIVGKIVPQASPSRGLRFRVYDKEGLCHAECGQLRSAFDVLKGLR